MNDAKPFTQVIAGGYVSDKKNSNGMDEFDLWAENLGQRERNFNEMRITKRNRKKAVGARR